MSGLLQKLRMLEAESPRPAVPPPEPARDQGFYHSRDIFPLALFSDPVHASPSVLQSLFVCTFPAHLASDQVLFLDTETTGLSGGAGTVAFEIGVGYFAPAGFVVEQFLMRDYPQEAPMLSALNSLMQRFEVLCTFNGRTFDVPLLQSRFLMNRIANPSFPPIHADVLHPARRIWKLRLQKCSLGRLEEQLLNVQREDDLPGSLVPQTYFQYLKDGHFSPLEKVLSHNKQDIVSLAQLLFFLCKQADQPEGIAEGEDLYSLARALEKSGDTSRAMHCYRLSTKTPLCGQAYEQLARLEKKGGNTNAAIALYQSMLKQGGDAVSAYEGLAKLYEHQRKDIPAALACTRQALLLLSEPKLFQAVQEKRNALQYRYARLRRKLSAQTK